MNSFFQSKLFKNLILVLGAFIILIVFFKIGMFVGMRKADFSCRWGENYHRVFGGPRGGLMTDFEGRDFIDGHGTAGNVIQIADDFLIVRGQENVEKTISTAKSTIIRRGREMISLKDIPLDANVVVIGSPRSDGTIEAKLIRIFASGETPLPPPPPAPRFNKIDILKF
jgi:hypothetical protein